jgi:hypothetical protein
MKTSVFGAVRELHLAGTRGVAIVAYGSAFLWPSEVISFELNGKEMAPIFRRKNMDVMDAAVLKEGGILLAAIEPPGRLHSAPVAGKLRMVWSPNGKVWVNLKVHYSAMGRAAKLARVDDDNIWVATSDGQILKWVG